VQKEVYPLSISTILLSSGLEFFLGNTPHMA
jgi:hypothetical protein